MAAKINQYERQARISLIMAAIGGLFALFLIFAVFQNFHLENFEIPYSNKGYRLYAILAAIAVTGLTTATGFFTGFNSAGHKRNKLSHLSWAGFFLNAAIATIALCVFVFFWLAKEQVVM
ncbi:MAG: hypothetical protein D6744_11640 [Planctomycetota bacterium]|nr:MAG: hypothetical protein D6744_11640 [Planctomycetota bacterium]